MIFGISADGMTEGHGRPARRTRAGGNPRRFGMVKPRDSPDANRLTVMKNTITFAIVDLTNKPNFPPNGETAYGTCEPGGGRSCHRAGGHEASCRIGPRRGCRLERDRRPTS